MQKTQERALYQKRHYNKQVFDHLKTYSQFYSGSNCGGTIVALVWFRLYCAFWIFLREIMFILQSCRGYCQLLSWYNSDLFWFSRCSKRRRYMPAKLCWCESYQLLLFEQYGEKIGGTDSNLFCLQPTRYAILSNALLHLFRFKSLSIR